MSQALKEHSLQTYIPPTRKPNMRSDRSKVNECEAYGYRSLCQAWKLLSPYEFGRYWRVVPLLIPTYYKNRGKTSWTKWTAEGIQFLKARNTKKGKFLQNPECTSKQYQAQPTNISCFLKNLKVFTPRIATPAH